MNVEIVLEPSEADKVGGRNFSGASAIREFKVPVVMLHFRFKQGICIGFRGKAAECISNHSI
jgi:hypothetical protein